MVILDSVRPRCVVSNYSLELPPARPRSSCDTGGLASLKPRVRCVTRMCQLFSRPADGVFAEPVRGEASAREAVRRQRGRTVVPTLSLPTLLQPYAKVDMLDLDVQGAEWALFNESIGGSDTARALDALDAKVMRLHVGTHDGGRRDEPLTSRERGLVQVLGARGWRPTWLVGVTSGACTSVADFRATPWGPICMADGALGFVNSRFV